VTQPDDILVALRDALDATIGRRNEARDREETRP